MPYVFDSSAFINGARHHYFPSTMGAVWRLVEEAIGDGRVIVVREVYRELCEQEDEISDLVKRHADAIVAPSQQVQRRAGQLQALFPKPGLRDRADPFVMAEAEARGGIVVTYEGITYTGEPARGAGTKMPALCAHEQIDCCTLAHALEGLGLKLD